MREEAKLYVVKHRGTLDVDEWVASHETTMRNTIPSSPPHEYHTFSETLVSATPFELSQISHQSNVFGVTAATPGIFNDDTEGAVVIHEDGSWSPYQEPDEED